MHTKKSGRQLFSKSLRKRQLGLYRAYVTQTLLKQCKFCRFPPTLSWVSDNNHNVCASRSEYAQPKPRPTNPTSSRSPHSGRVSAPERHRLLPKGHDSPTVLSHFDFPLRQRFIAIYVRHWIALEEERDDRLPSGRIVCSRNAKEN